jgi:beta-lactamase class A
VEPLLHIECIKNKKTKSFSLSQKVMIILINSKNCDYYGQSGLILKMKRFHLVKYLLAVLLLQLISLPVWAESNYPALHQCFDQQLQDGLRKSIDRLDLTEAVERKRLSVALVDISTIRNPRVAAVNGDHMVYAASLPKIAILLGAFKQIENGDMQWDDKTQQALTDMIRISSNRAASEMLRRVGPIRLAGILQSSKYSLYAPQFNGGLWCGKEYGKRGAWKRDPLHNLSHGATAMQTARFYYMLETDQLVSPTLTRHMKEILSKPAIHHKFVKGLEDRPGSKIYRKSGSWKRWHADSAIVENGKHKYIVVGLAEHPDGGKWLKQLITPLHDLIVSNEPPADSYRKPL